MALRLDDKRRRALARHLLFAIGATGVALSGCASEVIVERNANGGSGGTSSSTGPSGPTTAVSSSSSGGFTCTTPDPTPLEYLCIPQLPGGGCPEGAARDAQLVAELGPCTPMDPNFCWCEYVIAAVPCGPDPAMPHQQCCYYASAYIDELCEGRPFVVEGLARLAPSACRSDWMAQLDASAIDAMDEQTRASLADGWTHDGLAEHASIASFARFTLELLSVGAPAAMVHDAQRAMADEIRHAELCFALAARYAGTPCGPGVLPIAGSLGERRDLAALAVAAFREGCIHETLSALTALAARDRASDAAVRAVLGEIVHDEVAHAELAWRFVAWAVKRDPAAHAAVAAAVREASCLASDELDARADAEMLRAHGRIGGREHAAVLRAAMYEVVMPCAQAMLALVASTSTRINQAAQRI